MRDDGNVLAPCLPTAEEESASLTGASTEKLLCREFCDTFSPRFAQELPLLHDNVLYMVCDTSGSMRGARSELSACIRDTAKFALLAGVKKINLYFFNGTVFVLTNAQQAEEDLTAYFQDLVFQGATPLRSTLEMVLQTIQKDVKENLYTQDKCQILIATDGLPTELVRGSIQVQMAPFEQLLYYRQPRIAINILLMLQHLPAHERTNISAAYDVLDKNVDKLDVMTDYKHEMAQVMAARQQESNGLNFTYLDHLLKTVASPRIAWMDKLDEVYGVEKQQQNQHVRTASTQPDVPCSCIVL